jgi:hypothetical protein
MVSVLRRCANPIDGGHDDSWWTIVTGKSPGSDRNLRACESGMPFVLETLAAVTALLVAMLVLEHWGNRLAEHNQALGIVDTGHAAENAVFAVLSLFLAFTFSGAGNRFEQRRALIVEEANAIGTAWLRIDLLPDDRQPGIRDLFRRYLDARIETYRLVPDMPAVAQANAKAMSLQREIWNASVAAARTSPQVPPFTVYLPALNTMIDITTTRTAVTRFHPPAAVFVMIGVLTLVGSLFAGYGWGGAKRHSWLHAYGFAAVMAAVIYVTYDLEYPRLGFIRVDAADQVLVDLRQSMK